MIRKMHRDQNGQSLVEFALILPLLLLIVMGILEFGLMFNVYLTINNASREGARLGSVTEGDPVSIENRVVAVAPHLDKDNLVITSDIADVDNTESVTVKVEYDYQMITPIISDLLSDHIYLRSETTMRVE